MEYIPDFYVKIGNVVTNFLWYNLLLSYYVLMICKKSKNHISGPQG